MKETINISSFSSLYTLSFLFREEDSKMLDDVRVAIAKEKKIKIYNNIIYDILRSEIKENKT
jgi:hypothetical protein